MAIRRWYAAYTNSRHEKKVLAALMRNGFEAFLPTCRITRRWRNRQVREIAFPLFPGYVFVRLTASTSTRALVDSIPGLLYLVGSGESPIAVSDCEIGVLQSFDGQLEREAPNLLHCGDQIRVSRGPLAGFQGVLVSKKNRLRLVLRIAGIQQGFSVEIDANDLDYPTAVPRSTETSMPAFEPAGRC